MLDIGYRFFDWLPGAGYRGLCRRRDRCNRDARSRNPSMQARVHVFCPCLGPQASGGSDAGDPAVGFLLFGLCGDARAFDQTRGSWPGAGRLRPSRTRCRGSGVPSVRWNWVKTPAQLGTQRHCVRRALQRRLRERVADPRPCLRRPPCSAGGSELIPPADAMAVLSAMASALVRHWRAFFRSSSSPATDQHLSPHLRLASPFPELLNHPLSSGIEPQNGGFTLVDLRSRRAQ